MLRGELQNELQVRHQWLFTNARNYRYVEQVFRVSLWYIETLSDEGLTEPGGLWNRYIASSPGAAFEAIQAHGSAKAIVHVLLPGYMAQQNDPILTRCRMLWRCRVIANREHEVISFVTDHGEFVDYQDAVELDELEKVEPLWRE